MGTHVGGDVFTTRPDPGCTFSGQVGGFSDQHGQVVTDSLTVCADADGDGVPDPPPPPPTAAEVAAFCPAIPDPVVGVSPTDHGWTGLTSWFWDPASRAASASGSVRGHPVRCTVTPVGWTVDAGDAEHRRWGHQRVTTASTPGAEDDSTPLRYPYERHGTYEVTMTVRWQRTLYASGDQLGVRTDERTSTTDYDVWSISSVPAIPSS